MASRIIHFGSDNCNRVLVLRDAGYSVDACLSLPRLDSALMSEPGFAAVVMSEAKELARRNALALVRSNSTAPVILFENTIYCSDEADFDLVIPNLTPTRDWLNSIAAIIQHSRDLCAQSKIIHERTAELIQQFAADRERSRQSRQRSADIRARFKKILTFDPERHSSA